VPIELLPPEEPGLVPEDLMEDLQQQQEEDVVEEEDPCDLDPEAPLKHVILPF
jgi:hypothetical protein